MSELPRSVREYERFVATLKENFPLDEAMSHAVGGDYDGVGRIERAILEHFGLGPGMTLIDVGCGSGRLASALCDMDVDYLGTDVVADLLDYAAVNASPRFRFKRHLELTVPALSESIEMIIGREAVGGAELLSRLGLLGTASFPARTSARADAADGG